MSKIKWKGKNKADCIANFKTTFEGVDPDAKYYQQQDGLWVIEADAFKANIQFIGMDDENGKPVLMTMEEYERLKYSKLKAVAPEMSNKTNIAEVSIPVESITLEVHDKDTGRLKQRTTMKDGKETIEKFPEV